MGSGTDGYAELRSTLASRWRYLPASQRAVCLLRSASGGIRGVLHPGFRWRIVRTADGASVWSPHACEPRCYVQSSFRRWESPLHLRSGQWGPRPAIHSEDRPRNFLRQQPAGIAIELDRTCDEAQRARPRHPDHGRRGDRLDPDECRSFDRSRNHCAEFRCRLHIAARFYNYDLSRSLAGQPILSRGGCVTSQKK